MTRATHSGESCASLKMHGPITAASADRWLTHLRALAADGGDSRCLFAEIDSGGGNVRAAEIVADALSAWRGPRFVCIRNKCESAGLILLSAFPRRSAHVGSVIEFHLPEIDDGSRHPGDATLLVQARRRIAERLAPAFAMPVLRIEANMHNRLRLTANEARQAGIIDQVLLPAPWALKRRAPPGGGGLKLQSARV